jgi:hypothetical protein
MGTNIQEEIIFINDIRGDYETVDFFRAKA